MSFSTLLTKCRVRLYHSYIVNADTATDRASLWDSFKSSSSSNVPTPPTSATRAGPTLNANQRKRIRHLLKAARKDPRHTQMSLQSYLLMPIQRIPRYKLLLEALLECTPAVDCPDQGEPTISMALEVISKIASEMNERKRDNEGRQRLVCLPMYARIPVIVADCLFSFTGKHNFRASSHRWCSHIALSCERGAWYVIVPHSTSMTA